MTDFRSEAMDSREGRGRARAAWDLWEESVGEALLPLMRPALERIASSIRVEMLGFWLAWHLHGGFEGLERMGMHRATIYRKVSKFRRIFGQHPDDYQFPGVSVDPEAYLQFLIEDTGEE